MQPAGRGTHAQGRGVVGGVRPAAQSSQDGEGVEAVGQTGQVDVVADRDARQDPVPAGRRGGVGVDVDDHQARRAAGHTDTEVGVGTPPPGDPLLVEGRSVKAVAPPPRGQTGALCRRVRVLTALAAVRGRCLTARSEGVDWPATACAPSRNGQRPGGYQGIGGGCS